MLSDICFPIYSDIKYLMSNISDFGLWYLSESFPITERRDWFDQSNSSNLKIFVQSTFNV